MSAGKGKGGWREAGIRVEGLYNLHQLESQPFGIEAVKFFLRVRPAGYEGGHCGGPNDRISWRSITATRWETLRSSRYASDCKDRMGALSICEYQDRLA